MDDNMRAVFGGIFFIFMLVLSLIGFSNIGKPAQAASENNCLYIGSVGTVAYGYCQDPNTGLEFIGSSNGYMEIIE